MATVSLRQAKDGGRTFFHFDHAGAGADSSGGHRQGGPARNPQGTEPAPSMPAAAVDARTGDVTDGA